MKRSNDNRRKGNIVYARDNEPVEVMLRRLKRKVQEGKVLETVREKEYYEKPTTVRKKAKAAAQARLKKSLAKERQSMSRR